MFFRAELTDWLKENGDCKRVRHFQKYQKTFDRAMDGVLMRPSMGNLRFHFLARKSMLVSLKIDLFIQVMKLSGQMVSY